MVQQPAFHPKFFHRLLHDLLKSTDKEKVSWNAGYSVQHCICKCSSHKLAGHGKHYLQTIVDAGEAICHLLKIPVPSAKPFVSKPGCEDCRQGVSRPCEVSVYKAKSYTMKSLFTQCQGDDGCCKAQTAHASFQLAAILHKMVQVAHQVKNVIV